MFQPPSLGSVSQGREEVLQGANLAENQLLFSTFAEVTNSYTLEAVQEREEPSPREEAALVPIVLVTRCVEL